MRIILNESTNVLHIVSKYREIARDIHINRIERAALLNNEIPKRLLDLLRQLRRIERHLFDAAAKASKPARVRLSVRVEFIPAIDMLTLHQPPHHYHFHLTPEETAHIQRAGPGSVKRIGRVMNKLRRGMSVPPAYLT